MVFRSKAKTETTTLASNKEYFEFIKKHMSEIMSYSISGTNAFSKCDLLLYPKEGGIFIVEGSRRETEWKELTIRDIQSDIIKALNRGDVDEFTSLIQDVSIKALKQAIECTCKTLLHCAAEQGNIEIAEKLISLGVPVDIKVNKQSMTPLHAAIIWDQREMVKFLLSKNANDSARFKSHTAAELRKLKNTLNDRATIYGIFEVEKLHELLEEASNYHFKTRIFSLARRRIGELKSARTIKKQAKTQWAVKQGKKIQVYQEELDQACAEYARDLLLTAAKKEQERKLNRKVKNYHNANQAWEQKTEKHATIQKESAKRAADVLQKRKANPVEIDPLAWLKHELPQKN